MEPREDKTGNFLHAIQKYADEQKHKIESEVEHFKQQELKKAEDEGLRDAYNLIQKEMAAMRAGIASEAAQKEAQGRQRLYQRRLEIMEDVFSKATQKLIAYTKTDAYKETMKERAKEISAYLNGRDCVLYIKPEDEGLKGDLSACFNGLCSVQTSKDIKIGGINAYCEGLGIVVDQTLDTKLSDQKEWFLQNSGLKVK